MLSNEMAPLLLQKSEPDESPSSAVLKHAFYWGEYGHVGVSVAAQLRILPRGVSLQRAIAASSAAAGFALVVRGLHGHQSWA